MAIVRGVNEIGEGTFYDVPGDELSKYQLNAKLATTEATTASSQSPIAAMESTTSTNTIEQTDRLARMTKQPAAVNQHNALVAAIRAMDSSSFLIGVRFSLTAIVQIRSRMRVKVQFNQC